MTRVLALNIKKKKNYNNSELIKAGVTIYLLGCNFFLFLFIPFLSLSLFLFLSYPPFSITHYLYYTTLIQKEEEEKKND